MSLQIDVKEVRSLVPVEIVVDINGSTQKISGSIDYLNRRASFDCPFSEELAIRVFEHLNIVMSPPEDIYEAPEEVYQEAAKAQEEHQALMAENLGGSDE